ncbi:MAG: antibiotic biosynthesis monooxygenase [Candidatus Hydrogenedentes bacterium]|nr:antibiotic biosynthesis monooxygenase [Candidatus Hydrogenedentota bacterium]
MESEGKASGSVTVINVIVVKAEDQDRLVDGMRQMCTNLMEKQPGFVSARIYKSRDKRRVAVHANWASAEAFEAAFRDPDVLFIMRKGLDIVQPEWHIYECVHEAPGSAEAEA